VVPSAPTAQSFLVQWLNLPGIDFCSFYGGKETIGVQSPKVEPSNGQPTPEMKKKEIKVKKELTADEWLNLAPRYGMVWCGLSTDPRVLCGVAIGCSNVLHLVSAMESARFLVLYRRCDVLHIADSDKGK
jgi:hypothetical protein